MRTSKRMGLTTMGNKNKVDLHTHSTYSDGSFTPAEIVQSACDIGLRAVALTDHDTVGGVGEALLASAGLGGQISVIPGVEISADYPYQLHILGYFHPDGYRAIDGFLSEMGRERHLRNLAVIQKLNECGIKITASEVEEIAGKEVFGRPHIAAALVKKGVAGTLASAFSEYLADGRKAFVEKKSLPPNECVAAIDGAGGLPVIAHPSLTGLRLGELKRLAAGLIKSGLFGIEAYYPDHTKGETANYVQLAGDLDLLATGGSDFHGEYRKYARLGVGSGSLRVPDSVPDIIMGELGRRLKKSK